ncbi:MAG: galactose oxidase [Verrucomicrobiaceae bacterium]|nr:galactose oxidase [Verrucomicrobiaceae bacterium]
MSLAGWAKPMFRRYMMHFSMLLFLTVTSWTRLSDVPDARGFAGSFAGVQDGALIIAGGTHFTDKMPWEGGTKVWYDSIYQLDQPDGTWRIAGQLPRPNGYGVSISTQRGMLIAGGGNATEHYREVFWLKSDSKLPALPRPCAFMSGCVLDEVLYIAGGIDLPAATRALDSFWALDLKKADATWQQLPPCPGGGRILACMAAANGHVYLFSGAALKPGPDGKAQREWLRDAWSYSAANGWKKLPDLPRVSVAAPSPAPVIGSQIFILGGDDGSKANFEPKSAHPGFPRSILCFDLQTQSWSEAGEVPFSLVTTPAVTWRGKLVIPGGESRPGVRSPQVWSAPLTPAPR